MPEAPKLEDLTQLHKSLCFEARIDKNGRLFLFVEDGMLARGLDAGQVAELRDFINVAWAKLVKLNAERPEATLYTDQR